MAKTNPAQFMREVRQEVSKVTWPTREQVRNLTVLVFVISGILGLYIAAFDALFTFIVATLATRLG